MDSLGRHQHCRLRRLLPSTSPSTLTQLQPPSSTLAMKLPTISVFARLVGRIHAVVAAATTTPARALGVPDEQFDNSTLVETFILPDTGDFFRTRLRGTNEPSLIWDYLGLGNTDAEGCSTLECRVPNRRAARR